MYRVCFTSWDRASFPSPIPCLLKRFGWCHPFFSTAAGGFSLPSTDPAEQCGYREDSAHHCGSLSHPSELRRQNWGPQTPEEHPTSHYDLLMTKSTSLLLSPVPLHSHPRTHWAHHALTTKPHNPFWVPNPRPPPPQSRTQPLAWAAWGRVGPRGAAWGCVGLRGPSILCAAPRACPLASPPSLPSLVIVCERRRGAYKARGIARM